jgi:very-short-patch-repair endonuclease
VTVPEELAQLGGVATRAALLRRCTRGDLEAAVAAGAVVRLARGRYALAAVDEARAAAHALSGVLCLTSAAQHWGWAVKHPPERPLVSLPKSRRPDVERARAVEVRRLSLSPDDVVDGVTTRDRTLVDCLRHLAFDEALAVADSALRDDFSPRRLEALVRDAQGPHAGRMRRLAALATPQAANPFESVLRAIALGVAGLRVRPQVSLRAGGAFLGRPDLVDERLGIVLEADSFAWHGDRAALHADARRYNAFAAHGWLVLRFAWEDVMFHPAYVAAVLRDAVSERADLSCPECRRAS